VSARCGWCRSTAGSTRRCGRRSNRLPEDRLRAADAAEWVKRHEVDAGPARRRHHAEAQRIKDLEREVKELRRANEILKLASAFFAQAELDRR
jgi:hypothetical protein